MEHARKQYASDSEPLPKGSYDALTETAEYHADTITITETRYLDSRLEKIRHQLATEKIEQAVGRTRLPVWTDTQTIIFTDTPIPGITERATLFSKEAFNLAESPSDIVAATARIRDAEDTGDIQAVMETQGVSERTAYTRTVDARKRSKAERDIEIVNRYANGEIPREIADALTADGCKVSESTVWRVLKEQKF